MPEHDSIFTPEGLLIPKGLGVIIANRLALLHEFQTRSTQQAFYEKSFQLGLINTAPETLRRWLEKEEVVIDLFVRGVTTRKIQLEMPSRGLKSELPLNPQETIAALGALKEAWKRVVSVEVSDVTDDQIIKVRFAAVM